MLPFFCFIVETRWLNNILGFLGISEDTSVHLLSRLLNDMQCLKERCEWM